MTLDDRKLVTIERWVSITIACAAVWGIVWILTHPSGRPLDVVVLYAAITLSIPLFAATLHAPAWMTRWVNRWNNGSPKFRLSDIPGYVPKKGRYLLMEVDDPRQPIDPQTILSGTRWIGAVSAVCAAGSFAALLTGWLILRQPWMFASACGFGVLLAWEIYPRSDGIRYRTGFLTPDAVVRSLCLSALAKAADENVPLRDWHSDYFRIIGAPPDGSIEEFNAASWIRAYALLHNDLDTAARQIERQLALLPDDAPATQYLGLGEALYFYAVGAPDEDKSKLLAQRIHSINWDLPVRVEYIEAAVALAGGKCEEALFIARARLEHIGPEGGTARTQLERQMLIWCCDRASN